MIALYALLAMSAQEPASAPTVFGCEHYDSLSDTDGVGSYVDLKAVRDANDRWTLEFDGGKTFQATWTWVEKAKGLGRLEWRDGDVSSVGIVHQVAGSEKTGMPSFWLSEGEKLEVVGPGYMCNGRLEGGQ